MADSKDVQRLQNQYTGYSAPPTLIIEFVPLSPNLAMLWDYTRWRTVLGKNFKTSSHRTFVPGVPLSETRKAPSATPAQLALSEHRHKKVRKLIGFDS